MSTTLKVRLKHAEGSLIRLLGQVGRRGYDVLGVTARLSQDGRTFEVLVEFEPFIPLAPGKPRPAEVLPALVRKLCDVESAELVSTARPAGETPGNGGSHAKVPNPESKAK